MRSGDSVVAIVNDGPPMLDLTADRNARNAEIGLRAELCSALY